MSGPPATKRTLLMLEAYKSGASSPVVAAMFGVTKQRVIAAVRRHAPSAIRLHGQVAGVKRGPYRKARQP